MERIGIKLLRDGARLPRRSTEDASGFDLFASLSDGPVEVGMDPVRVPTGIALEVPVGLDAQIRPRSGLASRGVLSTLGTLDADYRGELFVTLHTLSPKVRHLVTDGDRIAQIVVVRLADVVFESRDELSETLRGSSGHGSTGR